MIILIIVSYDNSKDKILKSLPLFWYATKHFLLSFKIEARTKYYGGDFNIAECRKTFHKSRFTKRNDNIGLYIIAYFHFLYISTSRSICVHAFTIINYSDGKDLESGICKFSIFVPISTSYSIYFVTQTYLLQKFR